jgi:glycosyltransferase involved in cell wall biosynthesis
MHRALTISAVIPCFNEEIGVGEVIGRMPAAVDQVIVVDNASTDRTAEVARRLRATVIAEPQRGYGAAYQAGFAAAKGDLIATLDGDGAYPPEAIPALADAMLDRDWDFLSACRFPLTDPAAMGLTNRIGNRVLTAAAVMLFGVPLRDSQSGMWVFRRALLERMRLVSPGMAFSEEIKLEAIRCGARFGEAHIPYGVRSGSVKLQKWRDGWSNLMFLLRRRGERLSR